MADYYSQFSEGIDGITEKEAEWIQAFLEKEYPADPSLEKERKEWLDARFLNKDEDYLDIWPHFEWEIEKGTAGLYLWLRSDESFSEDHLAGFLRAFLKKFRPKGVVTINVAGTCSKPRVGEFGGSWMAISADHAEFGDTWNSARVAAEKMLEKMKKKRKK